MKRMHRLAILALIGMALVLGALIGRNLPTCRGAEPGPAIGGVLKLVGC